MRGVLVAVALWAIHSACAYSSAPAPVPLQALKPRIDMLTTKGWQAIRVFFLVSRQEGGYRVLMDPMPAGTATDEQKMYAELYVVAGLTKGISELVCTHRSTQSLCGARFDPAWRVEPKTVKPTLESLVAWTNETESALVPLWSGLCQLAKANGVEARRPGGPISPLCPPE
ncbi:MAG: hypothetical protein HOP13_16695 [Alphaproteobacteria bacterium]|nr:hypothetical protein [Alphaproteobacteria bacterium]